jgi:putative acetyltransferase
MIRPIRPEDDVHVAAIIRAVMPEYGADGPGFAIHDREVDAMYSAYNRDRAAYYVIEQGGRVLGGGGFAPLDGGAGDTCELRKMYFLPELRGQGWGARLIDHALAGAKAAGFVRCYLETLATMHEAKWLYEKRGFAKLDKPLGATGHFGCDAWYARDL